MHSTDVPKKTAVLAAVQLSNVTNREHADDIAELGRLVTTLGYEVVGVVSQAQGGLRAAAVLGPGKLRELAAYTGGTGVVAHSAPHAGKSKAKNQDDDEEEEAIDEPELDDGAVAPPGEYPHADVVVVDHEISPRQARNLESATDAEVLDRTGVIVEIFHRHANTREARLQVEIARLQYVVPRIRAGVKGAERQQGGIGGRGAGESALELDRRRVRDRVSELKAELTEIARNEETRRSRRQGTNRVALIGYTNAGKSSLMRALTSTEVLVEDKLFATLGTTVRALSPEVLPRILVSDTVGFIKKLPHDLVASFRSTLAEAAEASFLLFVVDASDPAFRDQLAVTREVTAEIGVSDTPQLLVLNKRDKLSDEQREALALEFPDAVMVSAKDPDDIAMMHTTIVAFFESTYEDTVLIVPYTRGSVAGEIRRSLTVVSEVFEEDGTHLRVKAPAMDVARIRALLA